MSDSATPWTVANQAPLSMEFFRQEYWIGLPFPSPGDLPDPGIKPRSPALHADALLSEPPGKPLPRLQLVKYVRLHTLLRIHQCSSSHWQWKWSVTCSLVSDSLRSQGLKPARLLCPWNFPGKNTGVGCHFLLQRILPTLRSNLRLLSLQHWQADSLPLHYLGRLSIKDWKVFISIISQPLPNILKIIWMT